MVCSSLRSAAVYLLDETPATLINSWIATFGGITPRTGLKRSEGVAICTRSDACEL